jgi:hypothetical protein
MTGIRAKKETMNQKETEKELIKSMAGCYKVTFKFAETFAPDKDYQYHERKFESATEYAFILEETENKVSIQHILFVGADMVIKHWRQDWVYENRELLSYIKDNEWEKIVLSPQQAKGTWTQKVFQVDDSPRYEGFGTWAHIDGRHFWESTTDAPLPRREITKRHDYNVLQRNSHIEIFKGGGWELEQDNLKIIRSEERTDTLLCMEKGLEIFSTGNYDAQPAKKWWEANKAFWADVRQCWSELFSGQDRIKIKAKVNGELLYMALFKLSNEFAAPKTYDAHNAIVVIKKVLEVYVEDIKYAPLSL